jgi:hypothetical protein
MWLAGVIDCEGWIGMIKNNRRNITVHYGAIGVGNTNKLLIDKIVYLTGIGNVNFSDRKPPAKPLYTWSVTRSDDVHALLLTIRDHLILKQKQADLVLLSPPKNERNPELRKKLAEQLTSLNKKGR